MASSTIEETAPPLATGRDHCQQLKDMVSKVDPSSMQVVVPSGNQTSTPPTKPAMDYGLLALASSGSPRALESFLNARRSSSLASGDEEAFLVQEPLLDGVTAGGDTALHVVAATHGRDVLRKARLIHSKAGHLLFVQNNKGDTPLHCAAREGANREMVSLLIDLAKGEDSDANRVKALLETENKGKWTVLHEAVRTGQIDTVQLLLEEDPQLASFPKDGISPMYLAILLENKVIAEILFEKSGGQLSYAGPNGKNALHAAVLRGRGEGLAEMVLGWNKALTIQQDENGSTPLHFAASMQQKKHRRNICLCLLKANPRALYQPDQDGSFPIHVAASCGAIAVVTHFLKQSPDCACLRDARGRTFLHVAVDRRIAGTVIWFACINQSFSWIWNMQDNDGNTALHLAVQKGSLRMFYALFSNSEVHLNLTNDKGETPLDIARLNVEGKTKRLYNQNSEAKIHKALNAAGAKMGIFRHDYLKADEIVQAKQEEISKMEMLKDSTQNLCVGSVLIATVTFGATFALPGGYRADDHTNGGTPTLAGRYTFDAFILANALAFAFSVMATVSLMFSGTPIVNPHTRTNHFVMAYNFMTISVKSLVAAFATGTYMMLAPVAPKSAIAVCAMSFLVLVYPDLEMTIKSAMMVPAVTFRRWRIRHKIVLLFPMSVIHFVAYVLATLSPIVVIFSLAALTYHKIEPAAQPPTPFT